MICAILLSAVVLDFFLEINFFEKKNQEYYQSVKHFGPYLLCSCLSAVCVLIAFPSIRAFFFYYNYNKLR